MNFSDRINWVYVTYGSIASAIIALWKFRNQVIVPVWERCMSFLQVLKESSAIKGMLSDIKLQLSSYDSKEVTAALQRIETTLSLQDIKFRAHLDATLVCAFETCDEGQITWVTSGLCDFIGADQRQIEGNGWINSLLEPDRARVVREWKYAVADERDIDIVMMFKNGKQARCFATPIKSKDFTTHGYLGYMREIIPTSK